jgi:hypothetical protein
VEFFAFWIEPLNDCSWPAPPPVDEVVAEPADGVLGAVDDEDELPHAAASSPAANSATAGSHLAPPRRSLFLDIVNLP